jgi:hypothetical protein
VAVGFAAHMSQIFSQTLDTVFKVATVQTFPGNGTHTITPETTSQQVEIVHKVPQSGSPRLKSIVALNP